MCGNYIHELWEIDAVGTEIPLDVTVFTATGLDTPASANTLAVVTNDVAKVGLYNLRLVVYYENSRDVKF